MTPRRSRGATVRASRSAHYRRPGGPWDTATLDHLTRGRLAVVDGDRRVSATELDAMVSVVAGSLRNRGVRRRNVVAWQLPNCIEAMVLYRACWRLGAVAAPIHHQAGQAEAAGLIAELDPACVIAGREEVTALLDGPVVEIGAAGPADVAVVLFTSGSSGVPKGVLHTHRSLAYKMRSMVEVHGLVPGGAALMPLPMAHVSGLLNGVLVPAAAGLTSVLMPKWDPGEGLALIERHGVSFMVGPPPLFTGIMEHPSFERRRVEPLRVVSTGAMGVSSEFVVAASEQLGAFVKRSYGATEIPTVSTCPDDAPHRFGATTDGRTSGDGELRVVDPATHRSVAAGTPGEVWFRGPEMFAGYTDPVASAQALVRGWFRTGDLGVLDDEGWLRIVGRLKDVIIRGGENIAPAEVERTIEAHPDVRQAVVVGYPDDRLGERVAAVVVADTAFDLDVCRAWFEQRAVARFKVPERVLRLDAIPTLPAGKPDLARLREMAANP